MARTRLFGSAATLCKCLVRRAGASPLLTVCIYREHRYVSLKVCTADAPVKRELAAFHHLNSLPKTTHMGRLFVRTLLDQFELTATSEHAVSPQSSDDAPSRSFHCLVHKPMLMSLFTFRNRLRGEKLTEEFLKLVLHHVLRAVDYLHSEAKLVHTGSCHLVSHASSSSRH